MGGVCDAYQAKLMLLAMEDKGRYYVRYRPKIVNGKPRAILYYLYICGILMIQEGAFPCMLERFFNAAVPKGLLFFDEQHKIQQEYNMKKMQELKASLSDMERAQLSEVSKQLRNLTEEEWEKLVGSSGFCGFEMILPFLDKEAQDLTADYMNPYRYQAIIDVSRAVREQEILQAVKELEEIAECFYRNMTIREKYCLQEDMEYMGPVRMCDVEDAQRSAMQKVKRSI